MNRKQAREFMMQMLYQMDLTEEKDPAVFEKELAAKNAGPHEAYCRAAYEACTSNAAEIDMLIGKYSRKWKISRMARTDIAVLSLAAAEILYLDDIPVKVSINEAVELAKKYGTESAPKFINAILGKITEEKGSASAVKEAEKEAGGQTVD